MIILVGSNKGGCSKSTTTINLAVALAKMGKSLSVVDADPQGSVNNWAQDRIEAEAEPYIQVVQMQGRINKQLSEYAKNYDIVLVDVAGRSSVELISALFVADVLLTPAQCSQLDLDQLYELKEHADKAPLLEKKYVLQTMSSTHATRRIKDRAEFVEYVSELEGFEVLDSVQTYRKPYQDSLALGLGVVETKDEQAAFEVNKLAKELLAIAEA